MILLIDRVVHRLKEEIKYPYYVWKNRRLRRRLPQITVLDFDRTLDKILEGQASVSRFGDGEYQWMAGLKHTSSFQQPDARLAARLREIAICRLPDLLVCMPPVFGDLSQFERGARHFWQWFLCLHRQQWISFLDPQKTYYNASITRPYMDLKDKSRCGHFFDRLKQIWQDKDLLIVEGEKTRLGVGNDLFQNAASIQRILAPATNAFDRYEALLDAACQHGRGRLVLAALGPTATVLCHDLCQKGIRAIDIGHIDVEYQWFLLKARKKIPLPGRAVHEAGQTASGVGELEDETYQKQILCNLALGS